MTDASYRNCGLARRLVTEIISDWQDRCDAVYLYANGSVLDFYPKFGFCRAQEYQYSFPVTAGKAGGAGKLVWKKKTT